MNKKVRSILFSVLTTALITTGSWTGYAVGGFSGQSNLQSQIAKDNATSKAKSSNVGCPPSAPGRSYRRGQ